MSGKRSQKLKLLTGFFVFCILLFEFSCRKAEAFTPSESSVFNYEVPDTVMKAGLEITWATELVTDLDHMAAIVGEGQNPDKFYGRLNGSGQFKLVNDSERVVTLEFEDVNCVDGRHRNGKVTVSFFYDPVYGPNPDYNAAYYHQFAFCARIITENYEVNGWRVEHPGGKPIVVYNAATASNYDPSKTRLSWTMAGKLRISQGKDKSKDITWDGSLEKTLINSTDTSVWKATKFHNNDGPIHWNRGLACYSGTMAGYTSANLAFRADMNEKPLIRDFTCSPVIGGGVYAYHPFVRGLVNFKTDTGSGNGESQAGLIFGDEDSNPGYKTLETTPFAAEITGNKAPCDNKASLKSDRFVLPVVLNN